MTDLLDAALAYASRGIPVFPLRARDKLPLTEHGFKDASADPATVKRWWTVQPNANIGVPTGRDSTFDAIDLDGPHAPEVFAKWCSDHGVSLSPNVQTGKGQQVYVQPTGRGNSARLLRADCDCQPVCGVDYRGDGGYVVAPPSVHPNGDTYTTLRSVFGKLPQLPPEAVESLFGRNSRPGSGPAPGGDQAAGGDRIPQGQRDSTLTSMAGSMRRRGMSAEAIEAALLVDNRDRCDPPLPPEDVARIARSVARYDPQGDTGDTAPATPVTLLTSDSDTGDSSDTGTPTRHVRAVWTATDLLATDFPPPKFAVPGIIAEGASLLAGPPKVGKSWLALGLALAVASGEVALGQSVESGPVLYLALEDTPRRLKGRLAIMLGEAPAPDGLTLSTICPPLSDGGDQHIEEWLIAHPDARLVVVDVFARMRGPTPHGVSAYDADYQSVVRFKTLADKYGVAFILVHHVRKADANDFLETVSGTNGLAAAADSVLVLRRARGRADAVLHITGRDVEESELALKFTPEAGSWTPLEGPAMAYTLGETRLSIIRHVTDHGPTYPKAIAEALGLPPNTVRQTCRRMVDDGQLGTDGNGRYHPVTAVTPVTSAGQPGDTPDMASVTRVTPTDEPFTVAQLEAMDLDSLLDLATEYGVVVNVPDGVDDDAARRYVVMELVKE